VSYVAGELIKGANISEIAPKINKLSNGEQELVLWQENRESRGAG
jgi:hypothetical protein